MAMHMFVSVVSAVITMTGQPGPYHEGVVRGDALVLAGLFAAARMPNGVGSS